MSRSTLAVVVVLAGVGTGQGAEYETGQLRRLVGPGTYAAAVGDVLFFSAGVNPTSPSRLKVTVEGEALGPEAYVVRDVQPRPTPQPTDELHAYIPVKGAGEARVTVTLIDGMDRPGPALKYEVRVSRRTQPPTPAARRVETDRRTP
jgi:hypothetical protein